MTPDEQKEARALAERVREIAVGQDRYASRNIAHLSMGPTLRELAIAIAAALDENERLREALHDIADGMGESTPQEIGRFAPAVARAALKGPDQ